MPRNNGHRPSKCQELNINFYIFTYLSYWFLLFLNISWPDLNKRKRSLTCSQHDCRKISELFHIIIRWVTVCTKWQFRTEYNFGGKLQTPKNSIVNKFRTNKSQNMNSTHYIMCGTAIWYTPCLTLWWYGKVPISSDCHVDFRSGISSVWSNQVKKCLKIA